MCVVSAGGGGGGGGGGGQRVRVYMKHTFESISDFIFIVITLRSFVYVLHLRYVRILFRRFTFKRVVGST